MNGSHPSTPKRLTERALALIAKVVRDKNVVKPAKGTRQCNCRNKMVTRQLGPGMFQQYTTQVRRHAPKVFLADTNSQFVPGHCLGIVTTCPPPIAGAGDQYR
jgi:hypothetical protein